MIEIDTNIDYQDETLQNSIVCPHSDVFEGTCVNCGMIYHQLLGTGSMRKSEIKMSRPVNKSITADLGEFGFNEQVIAKANQIYLQIHTNTKKGKKNYLFFYCVFYACTELGIKEDPISLAEKIGLDEKLIQTALNSFSDPQNEYKPPNIQFTPIDLIPVFCSKLNFPDEDIENVVNLASRLLQKDSDLNEEGPRKIAGAIIQYYMDMNGIAFNKKEFAKIIRLSDVTINNTYRKISAIDNS